VRSPLALRCLVPAAGMSLRAKTFGALALSAGLLLAILVMGAWIGDHGLSTDLEVRNLPPCPSHLFGTDWLGRDMLTRVLLGLRLSVFVGLAAASVGAVIGLVLGLAAAGFGPKMDLLVTWFVDLAMSLPHLVFQILIAFVVGGGTRGVMIAVAATHWATIARIMRAEALQLKSADYVQLSYKLGRSPWWVARRHVLPHLWPQFLVALILLFPHAISHEAALSFIGIGLTPHMPSMGILLSESLRHLSTGHWWLAVIPGAALVLVVKLFDVLAENLRRLLNPRTSQE
jgi:peptide/nickel transport system permease protein